MLPLGENWEIGIARVNRGNVDFLSRAQDRYNFSSKLPIYGVRCSEGKLCDLRENVNRKNPTASKKTVGLNTQTEISLRILALNATVLGMLGHP